MRKIISLVLAIVFAAGTTIPAYASGGVPYLGYTYDYWGSVVPSPAAYIPTISIGAADIDPSLGRFNAPEDLFVDINGDIYLMDTGNNRLVIFNRDLKLRRVIDSFVRDGSKDTFNTPKGVAVSNKTLDIYIADTENNRIVVLDQEGNFVKMFTDPQHQSFKEDFVFKPKKVAVDPAERVYSIVSGMYEGIMSFDVDGSFFGYYGTVYVSYSFTQWLWRFLATEEQRLRMPLFIPVEFQSMDIDNAGFVYTTNIELYDSSNKIKRLNPSGEDVLINYTKLKIIGDLRYRSSGTLGGSTSFVDIKARANGMYSALDSSRSRLYTYDSEGNLLYVIGGPGDTLGMGRYPTAVEVLDNHILILDNRRGEIVYYEETQYGKLINDAISLRYEGDESAAVAKWRKVLELNENYTLAYTGIGKALLAAGENSEAMSYLKKGMSVEYYSVAFKRHRNEVLKDNLALILSLMGLFILILVVRALYQWNMRRWRNLVQELKDNDERAARLKRLQEQQRIIDERRIRLDQYEQEG